MQYRRVGKYRADEPIPPGTRFAGNERLQRQLSGERLSQVAQLEEVARSHGARHSP
jgi:aryl-alcohol dehydrogenase-like predicted oxidoreductase